MPIPGAGIAIYFIDFVGLILLSFVVLLRKYAKARGKEKTKHAYLLIGITLTFSLMVITTIIFVVLFQTSIAVFIGPISTLILAFFIAYAIVKHQFLDIKPIIARTITFLFLIIFVALLYSGGLFVAAQYIFGFHTHLETTLLGVLLAAVITLSFQPLYRFVARITNRLFFKGQYDDEKLLSEMTRIMAETIDLHSMTDQILKKLTHEMKITKAAFLIIDNHAIMAVNGVGYKNHEYMTPKLEALFHTPRPNIRHFTFEELSEGSLKGLFRELDISIAIPLKVETNEVAILILGPKESGEAYFKKDIDLLTIFAPEAGIAIQNAKAYEKIKKFSKELEQKVEERTQELKKAREVSRLKDEFVFLATHELRTPVIAIKGFLELVSSAKKKFPRDVQEHLSAISAASNHLGQLITDLLWIARSESGTC